MTEAQYLTWLEELLARGRAVPVGDVFYRERVAATAWLSEAESALAAVFPIGHALRQSWQRVLDRAAKHTWGTGSLKSTMSEPYAHVHFEQAFGVIQAATDLVRNERVRGLLDGIRAETVGEVLDQAAVLLAARHTVAATVLAGGALETHLRHLCVRNDLQWPGDGSINKYDAAIAQARNAGTVSVYSPTDSRLIGGWGGMRNDAAHDPVAFRRTLEDVGRMIDGIREFIARVP